MAAHKKNPEPEEIVGDSETDRESFSSSDEDVQDHIMLADRRLLLLELERKRKMPMDKKAKRPATKKALPWLRTQCSIMKIYKLRTIIKNSALRGAIDKMGFGPLLKVGNMRMPLRFLKYLVTRFDPYECALYDHTGFRLEFGRMEIGSAIGVPFGGIKIPDSINKELNLELRNEFGIIGERGEEVKLPLTAIHKKLSEFTTPSDEFKRWFIAYVLTCFLCPTTVDSLSANNIPAISVAANAEKYNWAEYVLRWLRRFSQSFHGVTKERKKTPDGHGGCLAALLFIYLESADDAYKRGLPEVTDEDVGTMCFWTKELLAARLKEEIPLVMKAKKIAIYKDLENSDDTLDKISIKEYIKETPGVMQKVRSYKRKTSSKKMKKTITKFKLQEVNDKRKSGDFMDIDEHKVDKKPSGIVIKEGNSASKEYIVTDSKGKGKVDSLEAENQYLWKRLRKLEKYERMAKANSSMDASGEGGTSNQQSMGSVGCSDFTTNKEANIPIAVSTVTGECEDANVQQRENVEIPSSKQSDNVAGPKDMTNPANWIMVVYVDLPQKSMDEQHPGVTKEDIEAYIEMFKAEDEELEKQTLQKQVDLGLEDFLPSFDLGFCTPEPCRAEDGSLIVENTLDSETKSSGSIQIKPPRRRLQPLRYQDHVLPKNNIRRNFKDPRTWDEVKKSFVGMKGKNKEDDIVEKVWMYVTSYKSGKHKWCPVLDYGYYATKFNQNMMREELDGTVNISNALIDLYALRLMSKWKVKKDLRFHCPIYILPSEFSKIVMDDFLLGGIATSFEDIKKFFLMTTTEGSIIFKHAERVFVPILSKTKRGENDNEGLLHWWCICINFAQPHVDVLDSLVSSLDRDVESCVQQLVSSVLTARALVKNKKYDSSNFLRGGQNGVSSAKKHNDMHSSGLYVMKWFEDWDGLYESNRYEDESGLDFKKWMVADLVIDGDNKQLYSIVPQLGIR